MEKGGEEKCNNNFDTDFELLVLFKEVLDSRILKKETIIKQWSYVTSATF